MLQNKKLILLLVSFFIFISANAAHAEYYLVYNDASCCGYARHDYYYRPVYHRVYSRGCHRNVVHHRYHHRYHRYHRYYGCHRYDGCYRSGCDSCTTRSRVYWRQPDAYYGYGEGVYYYTPYFQMSPYCCDW